MHSNGGTDEHQGNAVRFLCKNLSANCKGYLGAWATQEKKRAEKRLNELDNLIAKIYEDRLSEKITERNFSMLSQKYQQEQTELETKIEALTAQLASTKEQENGINQWMDLIKQFSSPTELTAEMLNTLIEKILVHEATKDADGNRTQEIEIVYRFVGKID